MYESFFWIFPGFFEKAFYFNYSPKLLSYAWVSNFQKSFNFWNSDTETFSFWHYFKHLNPQKLQHPQKALTSYQTLTFTHSHYHFHSLSKLLLYYSEPFIKWRENKCKRKATTAIFHPEKFHSFAVAQNKKLRGLQRIPTKLILTN